MPDGLSSNTGQATKSESVAISASYSDLSRIKKAWSCVGRTRMGKIRSRIFLGQRKKGQASFFGTDKLEKQPVPFNSLSVTR
jgi:hypothetical protein